MEHFMALLSSGKAQWRLTAVYGLEFTADTRAGEALYKVLNNPDPVMRREAALAIGRRGGEGAAGYLQKALKSEESETVKNAIMEALGKLAGGGN
jgi:HEAT repeat protein